MIPARDVRRHRFPSVQLAVTALVMLAIGGCKSNSNPPEVVAQVPPPKAVMPAGKGMDTPIVISGGSIHFRAKRSGWKPCDDSIQSSGTTCYKADFAQADKTNWANYQLFNDYDLTTVPITNVAKGWEVDVVDSNPDHKHMVLVCAESSDYTSCNHDPIKSDFIYVIAVGGSFEMKDPINHPEKVLYHDGTKKKKYDRIYNIALDASGGKDGTEEPCTESRCALFLSTVPGTR